MSPPSAVRRENSRLEIKHWHHSPVEDLFKKKSRYFLDSPEKIRKISPRDISEGFFSYITSGPDGESIRLDASEIKELLQHYIAEAVPAVGAVEVLQMLSQPDSIPPRFSQRKTGLEEDKDLSALEWYNKYYKESVDAGIYTIGDIVRIDSSLTGSLQRELEKQGKTIGEYTKRIGRPTLKTQAVAEILGCSLEDAAAFINAPRGGGHLKG